VRVGACRRTIAPPLRAEAEQGVGWIERQIAEENTVRLVEFIRASKRGIARESGRCKDAPEEGGAAVL